jgi:hypothetical protein
MKTNFFETERISGRAGKALTFGLALLLTLFMLLLVLQAASEPAHAADPFTVDRSDDPDFTASPTADDCTTAANDCSLRGAIIAANSTSGADTIQFAIPDDPGTTADDVKTIFVTNAGETGSPGLPVITEAVTINGYSQPGASANTNTNLAHGTNANLLIMLNGGSLGSSGIGLRIGAPDVVVKGLAINCFLTGIFIQGDGSRAVIEGNFIGAEPSVCTANSGVNIFGNDNTIGGKEPAARNLISGNLSSGLNISGNGGNTIQGNLIGTRANGTDPLGNQVGVKISSPNNTVGGDEADSPNDGDANRIAFNGSDGVQVLGGRGSTFYVGNRILNNSIFSNGNLGIDLDGGPGFSNPDADGVTANDRKDRDTGPNTLQNFPRLASATTADPGITTIKGSLNSRPRKTFLIQFFSSETKNSAGFAEGKTFVGQLTKKTNREGKFSFTLRTVLPTGENLVTATATSLDTSTMPATPKDTSEFSRAVTAS